MVSSRKRGRQEMEAYEPPEPPKELSMIERIRNMWEFANLMQWIYLFGKAIKIDEDLDIEELEMECLKPQSKVLSEIGLALLKFVSSHRGLTPEIFDEYTRRQYVAKAPHRNPFGIEEEPSKFGDFDIFTKIRVLQQLTQWTMINPDRIRERMEEQKDGDQLFWRIEPFGWDADENTYFVLDDDRLYRQTDPPPPPPAPKPKKSSKKAKAALRASKRRKVAETPVSDEEGPEASGDEQDILVVDDNGLGGSKWECLAISLDDLNTFISSKQKSRDPNEKMLRARLAEELLPLLEKRDEARKRKQAQKERELLNLEKLATAKRSSRIAGKLEQQKQEEDAREAERKKFAELDMARKEQEKWLKLEKERESRMMTREQRLKEREARRILHEEELASLSEDNKKLEAGESRISERHLKAEIERKKQALEELADEDDWVFDCICGAYGQVDDGSHSISCEKCNIWQHTKCVGIKEEDADGEAFRFVCQTCKRRAAKEVKEAKRRVDEAKRRAEEVGKAKHQPKITLKIKRPGSSSSPAPPTPLRDVSLPASSPPMNGIVPMMSPQKPIQAQTSSPARYSSPYGNGAIPPPQHQFQMPTFPTTSPKANQTPGRPNSQGSTTSSHWSPPTNGYTHGRSTSGGAISMQSNSYNPFSLPYSHSPADLPPPQQRIHSNTNGILSPAGIVLSPPHLGPANGPQSHPHQPTQTTPGPRLQSSLQNGTQQLDNQIQRRSSMNIPSPLVGAPVLMPSPSYNPGQLSSVPAKHDVQSTPARQFSPSMHFSSPAALVPQSTLMKTDPSQGTALPHAITGISPIKHSPQLLFPANDVSTLGVGTPSGLPPVNSLTPSPQLQNLSPPIKKDEIEAPKSVVSTPMPVVSSITSQSISPTTATAP